MTSAIIFQSFVGEFGEATGFDVGFNFLIADSISATVLILGV
jgi:hypothetical protein